MILGSLQKSSFLVHYRKASDNKLFTFALGAIVVAGYDFLIKKILHHCQYFSIIVFVEIEGKVPGVIKRNGLVPALGTYHSG